MPYFATSQEWLKQSSLLLQARPSTTRISTKYTVIDPTKIKVKAPSKAAQDPTSSAPAPPQTSRATLTLKAFDPVSGVTLKYQTTKAQEVGRLVASLGRLGRNMAGLPELKEDVNMIDVAAKEDLEVAAGSGIATPVGEVKPAVGPGGGAQGGKKKKKGKK